MEAAQVVGDGIIFQIKGIYSNARVVQRKNVSLPRRRSRVRVPSLAPDV